MKVKILKKNLIVTALCLYFISKLLWDSFLFGIFEAISLLLICYAFFLYFYREIKKENILIITVFLVFSGYILLDCFLKCSLQVTFRAVYEYIFYFSMIFAMGYYLGKCNIERLVRKIHAFGLIIAVLSWYEYLSKSYLIGSFENVILYSDTTYTFRSAVFSRSYLSHGMVLGFISLCAYYMYLKTNKKKYIVSSFFCWASILTTSSRGPLVATFIALISAYVMNQYRISKKLYRRVLIWIAIFGVVLVGFGFLKTSFTVGVGTIDYFLYRMRQIINWTGDAGNVGRLGIWKKAIDWFKTDILFGIGPSKTGSWGEASIGVTESGVLKHLCELGLLGFSIYYSFIYLIVKKGINKYKMKEFGEEKIEFILFFSVVICVFINNITLQSSEEIMVSFIYSFGLGGLISGHKNKSEYIKNTVEMGP